MPTAVQSALLAWKNVPARSSDNIVHSIYSFRTPSITFSLRGLISSPKAGPATVQYGGLHTVELARRADVVVILVLRGNSVRRASQCDCPAACSDPHSAGPRFRLRSLRKQTRFYQDSGCTPQRCRRSCIPPSTRAAALGHACSSGLSAGGPCDTRRPQLLAQWRPLPRISPRWGPSLPRQSSGWIAAFCAGNDSASGSACEVPIYPPLDLLPAPFSRLVDRPSGRVGQSTGAGSARPHRCALTVQSPLQEGAAQPASRKAAASKPQASSKQLIDLQPLRGAPQRASGEAASWWQGSRPPLARLAFQGSRSEALEPSAYHPALQGSLCGAEQAPSRCRGCRAGRRIAQPRAQPQGAGP